MEQDLPFAEAFALLANHYELGELDVTRDFLHKHPELISYLMGSVTHIEKHFPGSPRTLSVEYDEDDEPGGESVERLYVLISVSPYLATAQERMNRLDDEWALDVCDDTNELIVIDLDYT